jgi:hypothetical protein
MVRDGALFLTKCMIAAALCAAAFSPVQAEYAQFGPLLPAERSSTETSRYVAAEVYRDAYCAKWTDRCTLCQRNSANDQPACQPVGTDSGTCQRQPIQCQAVLKSIHRVCLSHTDGCNYCTDQYCTLMACQGKPVNYRCTALRTKEFQKGDINGHWRLTDPRSRSCELIFNGQVSLTASCVSLGAPITRLLKAELADGKLTLLSADNEALLIFGTSNPDSLDGVAPWQGYRLDRLEPRTFSPYLWEEMWELRAENSIVCTLFLSMRRRRLDDQTIEVLAPLGVAFQSGCVSSTDPGVFRFSRSREQGTAIEGGRRTRFFIEEPLNIPVFTGWRHEVFDLVFHDASGRETVFKMQEDRVWRAEIVTGDKPLVLRLRRKPD